MTRDDAIKIAKCAIEKNSDGFNISAPGVFVDTLITLDLLKVEPPELPTSVLAAAALEGQSVTVVHGICHTVAEGKLSVTSAQDLVGRLLKAGFKITR